MNHHKDTDKLVREAVAGHQYALEKLIEQIKMPVYNLALRMLQHPQDAEDMAQEILIKIVTHLSSFRGESAFTTWVYRLATNHLLNEQRKNRRQPLSFERLGEALQFSLHLYERTPDEEVEDRSLIEEVKRHCTLGMLQCLDKPHRMALILGELYGVTSKEGGAILEISPAAFRKRLSRARSRMVDFVTSHCGIIDKKNPCRCHKHVQNKIRAKLIDPDHLHYANQTDAASERQALLAEQATLAKHRRTAALLRAHPLYQASDSYAAAIKEIIDS